MKGSSIEFREVVIHRSRPDGSSFYVLREVSFVIPGGARVAVVGASGSGKTSLLRLINRLDDPQSGAVLIGGKDVLSFPAPGLRRQVGFVFQQPRLFDGTVVENLNRPLVLAGWPLLSRQDAIGALERVDLSSSILDSHARELSVGQQQRVVIARSLVLNPQVLLLDEPTSALDQRSAALILDLLVALNLADGITMMMVTHSVEHASHFGGHSLALREGEARVLDDIDSAVEWALAPDETDLLA